MPDIPMKLQVKKTMLLPDGPACTVLDFTRDTVSWSSLEPNTSVTIRFRLGKSPLESGTEVPPSLTVKVVRAGLFPYDVLLRTPNEPDKLFLDGGALDIGPRE